MPAGRNSKANASTQTFAPTRKIILVDQGSVRGAAREECAEAMARLEEARAAWHSFEREDKPSFARWRAREFGPILSESRELEVQIRDLEAIVREVEMEMRRGFIDPHGAYRRVMARRGNPVVTSEERKAPRNDAGVGRPLSEFEQEALFQEWVQRSLGTNPDKMDDDAYSASFEAFKSHMFRARPPDPVRLAPAHDATHTAHDDDDEEEEQPPALDARVKELYRLLVRRLHPDLRADGNVAVSALWHEVQEAYAASDIAQLEILLALSDIESARFSEQTSVSQMRAVLAELERALFALDDTLRQARGEEAWNFARAGAVSGLRLRVERELHSNLRARTDRLTMLKRTIAVWSRSALANRAVTPEQYAELTR